MSENEMVTGLFPLAYAKNPNAPAEKTGSTMLNWKVPFRNNRISRPSAQTPSLTCAGAPGGASLLDSQLNRG